MEIREPAVAGSFYPATAENIARQIEEILSEERPDIDLSYSEKEILGGVLPHAGYIYSGYETVHFFEILRTSGQRFDTVFIIHPNHRGYGPEIALDENDVWKTPLGNIKLDVGTMAMMDLPRARISHRDEHSGEVIVPFLQYFLDYEVKIIPLSINRQDSKVSKELAKEINSVRKKSGLNFLVLASSDLSHYVHPEIGEKIDKGIIDKILKMDAEEVYREIKRTDASVCGYGPIMTLMNYVKLYQKNPQAAMLKFGNSGKKHPSDSVVDYASIVFFTDHLRKI